MPVKWAVVHNEIAPALEVLRSSKRNFQFLIINFQNERTVRSKARRQELPSAGVPLWGVRPHHPLTCARAGGEGDGPTEGWCPRSHHAEERSGQSPTNPHPGLLTPQRVAAALPQPALTGQEGTKAPNANPHTDESCPASRVG